MGRAKNKVKLGQQQLNQNDVRCVSPDAEFEGNVFLTGKMLVNTLRAAHPCCAKNSECLKVVELLEMKQGHFRCLKVTCSSCSLDIFVDEEPQRSNICFRRRFSEMGNHWRENNGLHPQLLWTKWNYKCAYSKISRKSSLSQHVQQQLLATQERQK